MIVTAAAGADRPVQTPSIFVPASTPAKAIRELALIVFGITGVIFLVVAGLTVYALMRFRRRRGDDGREPPCGIGSLGRPVSESGRLCRGARARGAAIAAGGCSCWLFSKDSARVGQHGRSFHAIDTSQLIRLAIGS